MGKGAEGNGETPVGKECLVRPHRTQSEEAQRAPTESESFPAAPIHSTKVSKLSLPQSGALTKENPGKREALPGFSIKKMEGCPSCWIECHPVHCADGLLHLYLE